MKNHSDDIIKKYDFWTVKVYSNQEYLGRCVIWCNRENALDLTDATEDEKREFFQIIKNLKMAIEKAFNPDWMNYSFLGNSARHLHCQMVPRYKNEREFSGVIFKNKRWGYNWLLDESYITSSELLQSIKTKIKDNLDKI
jgi:diadenosine tetraphosphate (Ap4A) HIT family hydrolase